MLENDQFLIIDQLPALHHRAVVVLAIAGHQAGLGAGLKAEELTLERNPHHRKMIFDKHVDLCNAQFYPLNTPNAHFVIFQLNIIPQPNILDLH